MNSLYSFQKISLVLVNNSRLYSKITSNLNKLLIKMPRDTAFIVEAQKQKMRNKERKAKYIPGTVSLQILGSGAPGSSASVYLFTDQSRYLFNCGEGTQRLAHEHKTKLARLEHIFMTRTSWGRIGGLPGLSLTVQDAGVPNLTLHGPRGLKELFTAMQRFVILNDLKVDAPVCEDGDSYDDAVINVRYVPLFKNHKIEKSEETNEKLRQSPTVDDDGTDYFAHENSSRKKSPTRVPEIDWSRNEEDSVMAYICKIKPRPGALSLEKCVEKKVPPGPLLGKLKNGADITLPDGTVVMANEVRGPDDPGPVFIVIDIPSEEYLESLDKNDSTFSPFQSTASSQVDVALIVIHFSSEKIVKNPIYRKFMDKFSASTKHLILNESNKFSGYVATHRIQWQLNQLNEHVFPLLGENLYQDINPTDEVARKKLKLDAGVEKEILEESCVGDPVTSLTCFHLRPRKGLDRSMEQKLCPEEYIKETAIVPGFTESLSELRNEVKEMFKTPIKQRSEDFPKLLFLGTGSCIPNKTRNVSSILVHTSPDSCMLLDCGEGTCDQIVRFYGRDAADDIFKKLGIIYVSHLHADHHIGLIGLLQKRREVLGPAADKVLLLAPQQISPWLYFYDKRIESIKDTYELVHNASLLESPMKDNRITKMGINSISTCLVRHCPHSYGISIEINHREIDKSEPIKITYSGDTMPSDDLVELGKNSTVLIHEATMEDELAHQAKFKMHSTLSQAIEQGRKMNSKYTLLTHFSQRYAKLPRIEENSLDENVGIAFDNMEIVLSDLENLPKLYPTLKIMFSEHCEEMEQKSLKRNQQNVRRAEIRNNSPVR